MASTPAERTAFWNDRQPAYRTVLKWSGIAGYVVLLAFWAAGAREYEPEVLMAGPALMAFVTVVLMAIANVAYLLVPIVELLVRPRNPERLRRWLYAVGLTSVVLITVLPAVGMWAMAIVRLAAG